MMLRKFIINSILLISIASCEKIRFDNYTLYKILPENGEQIKTLQDIRNNDLRYDFWSEPVDALDYVSVMSSPQDKNDLEDLLNRNRIKYDVTMKNVQEFLDKETVRTYTRSHLNSMTWDAYYNLRDIHSWLVDIALTQNSDVASIVTAGRSHEGREILGVKISHGPGRRAILVEGTMHAREWITTTAVCYIINELLLSNDTDTMAAARDFDWYIFPVTNPDGYVWSHERFRMWRKNRRPTTGEHIGVDLNRNWNSNWLVSGSSTNPASDIYAGPGPFSEPETRSFSSYIHSIDKLELFLSFHSFGHLLLVPFGNSTAPYDNYHDAINIGRRAMGALSVRYGTQYVTGNIAEAIYMATGGCIDWVKERARVPLVYCYELRDRGQHGFLLPEDQILPNNQEVMDSVLELIHQAKRFGYMTGDGGQTKMYTNSLLMFILVSGAIFL